MTGLSSDRFRETLSVPKANWNSLHCHITDGNRKESKGRFWASEPAYKENWCLWMNGQYDWDHHFEEWILRTRAPKGKRQNVHILAKLSRSKNCENLAKIQVGWKLTLGFMLKFSGHWNLRWTARPRKWPYHFIEPSKRQRGSSSGRVKPTCILDILQTTCINVVHSMLVCSLKLRPLHQRVPCGLRMHFIYIKSSVHGVWKKVSQECANIRLVSFSIQKRLRTY